MDSAVQAAELNAIFRHALRARRVECGFTQAALAEYVGTTQPFIAQLESGSRLPNLELLAKLAEALRTTPDALLRSDIFLAKRA